MRMSENHPHRPRSAVSRPQDQARSLHRLLLHRPFAGHEGHLWQYTAIDIASGYAWAELHTSERNPIARDTRGLVHHVASELAAAGWKLGAVISDNGSEFAQRVHLRACGPGRKAPSHPSWAPNLKMARRAPCS
jgi:hypothetical protein